MPRAGRGPRVIAGEAGGRRLVSPPGDRVRPTTDRVKESVFAALGPHRLAGARVLDLYAGTGALALEALSRGAARAVLVERDADAGRAIVANLERTGMADRARLRRDDVRAVLAGPASERFDLVFLDPPYDLAGDELEGVIRRLVDGGWAADHATLVVERAGGGRPPSWPPEWRSTWERCYGDTLVLFAQRE
jgi:16S rRNA (guanine966-N2)-methyltransferase